MKSLVSRLLMFALFLALFVLLAFPVVVQAQTGEPPQPAPAPSLWMDLVQTVLLALVTSVAGSVTAFFFARAKLAWAEFKRSNADVSWELNQAATMAVKAAEQVYNAAKKAGLLDQLIDKKQYALDVAERFLESRGIYVDLHALDAAIEAAVYEEFNRDREPVGQLDARLASVGQ